MAVEQREFLQGGKIFSGAQFIEKLLEKIHRSRWLCRCNLAISVFLNFFLCFQKRVHFIPFDF